MEVNPQSGGRIGQSMNLLQEFVRFADGETAIKSRSALSKSHDPLNFVGKVLVLLRKTGQLRILSKIKFRCLQMAYQGVFSLQRFMRFSKNLLSRVTTACSFLHL